MSWQFPQGIEVLVKKASIDPDFAELLLADREAAVRKIELELGQSEAMMLEAVPAAQLEAIIAQTTVPQEHRRAFLGNAAAAMLAALAGTTGGLAEAGLREIPAPTGVRPDLPEPPAAKADSFAASVVIAVLAKQLRVPKETISCEARLAEDLHVSARGRETLRRALAGRFEVPMPAGEFQKRQTVGQVIEYIESVTAVGPRVIRVIAQQLRLGKEQVTAEKSLVDDLKVSTAQRSRIRRELSREFRLYIPLDAFRKFRTVADVIRYIDAAVKKRQTAGVPKEPPVPASPVTRGVRPDPPPVTKGIRPDVPPAGGSFGVRP